MDAKITIIITSELYDRLKNHATGFDTPEHVVEKLLNHFESCVNEPLVQPVSPIQRRKKDFTKYSFKGHVYGKSRLVLAIVKDYVLKNPDITFDNLLSWFPNHLQGSMGVINKYEYVQEKIPDKSNKRHFMKPEEIIQLSDCKVVTCTEWGIGNINDFLRYAKDIGYEITTAMNLVKNNFDLEEEKIQKEISRVHRKVPQWMERKQQINSRILIAFLKLRQRKTAITPDLLASECTEIQHFQNNYTGMKRIAEHNHAKVFQEDNGIISLWSVVEHFILAEYAKQ